VKTRVILDTGPLVALIDAAEKDHDWAMAQWGDIAPPLLTCESVISEACFLLDQTRTGSAAVLEMLLRKAITIPFRLDDHLHEVHALRKKYSDVPMSVADASLVRMAEQLSHSAVLTVDRDFKLYRKHRRHVIPLIVPPR
jgi:predicted nucleic acid-binding protein